MDLELDEAAGAAVHAKHGFWIGDTVRGAGQRLTVATVLQTAARSQLQ